MSNVTDTENRPMRDYNIGRRFIKAETNVGGKIVEQAGVAYVIKWDDGTDGFVRVDDLAAADNRAREEMVARDVRNLEDRAERLSKPRQPRAVEEHVQQAPTARSPTLASQAAEKLAMLQSIRAGLDLDPKAPDFSQRVAARLKRDEAAGLSRTATAPGGKTKAASDHARPTDATFQTNVDAALKARLRNERRR